MPTNFYSSLKFQYGDAIAFTSIEGNLQFGVVTEVIRTQNARGLRDTLVVQPKGNALVDSVDPEDALVLPFQTYSGELHDFLSRCPGYTWAMAESQRINDAKLNHGES
jgi:hypothetical protein